LVFVLEVSGHNCALRKRQREQEPQVEVLTNRLTDDEKRKYGSTGELLAPESTRDDSTTEESYNGDYK
jgi:hypothetical protein